MQREFGSCFSNQASDPQILNEDRVDSGRIELSGQFFHRRQFVGKGERVHGDVPGDSSSVEELHEFVELLNLDICRPSASIEAGSQPEIDRVGAVFDSGAGTRDVTGRSK